MNYEADPTWIKWAQVQPRAPLSDAALQLHGLHRPQRARPTPFADAVAGILSNTVDRVQYEYGIANYVAFPEIEPHPIWERARKDAARRLDKAIFKAEFLEYHGREPVFAELSKVYPDATQVKSPKSILAGRIFSMLRAKFPGLKLLAAARAENSRLAAPLSDDDLKSLIRWCHERCG